MEYWCRGRRHEPAALIDAIVRQTTVLIAQLSTAAGLRSPLAHIADQVFLTLAQEIEAQGVSRKVAADMFGLALRSYQRKVQRLGERGSSAGQTLWEAVLDYVVRFGPVRREALVERFRNDDDLAVSSVLADLVTSGLVYSSGRGEAAVFGVTSEADRSALSSEDAIEARAILLWGVIFRAPGITTTDLLKAGVAGEAEVRASLARLLADSRVTRPSDTDDAPLTSGVFFIPPRHPQGWEAAVFDHFQALANAVIAKLRQRTARAPQGDLVGGTTLHFGVYAGHPHEERVYGILRRVREDLNVLWNEVVDFNREHPVPDDAATRVTFYFGQSVRPPDEDRPIDPNEARPVR